MHMNPKSKIHPGEPGLKSTSPFPPWQSAFTLDALRRAWRVVRANQGTAGADGETVAKFEQQLEANLQTLRAELLAGHYRPRRVTQVLVPKANSEWRPLSLWAVRDRVAQRAACNYLEPVLDRHFLPCSYGFRPGRTTKDAALAVQQARQAGAQWVLDADIKDCFGQMDSGRLLGQLRRWQVPRPMNELIQHWLSARIWNAWLGSGRAGTSQGSPLSPLLCNIYLHPFDEAMQPRWLPGWQLVRYADDLVVLAGDEKMVRQAQRQAAQTLQQLGLQLHPQKTCVKRFTDGFQFVGWFFIRNEQFELK